MIPSVCVSTLCAIFFIFYFQQHQHHHQYSNMDTNMTNLTSSTTTNTSAKDDQQQQQLFDTTGKHQRQIMQQQQHYQEHFQQAQQAAARNQLTAHLPLRFNPLTPPGLPQAILPASPHFYTHSMDDTYNSILTPRHTPPMDITPPKSPISPTVTPTDHYQQQQQHHDQQQQDQELMSNSSEDLKNIADSDGEENTHLPIYNSHGKMKTHQCKKCDSVTITKWTYYEHLKTHMNPDKILQCHKCPFVTELKHHLEYHIRKHTNLKPFQCDKCSYSGVNKSMLNSHRKSHSSVYQYSCIDCDYSTKYCHSFKLHLRKYSHQPGMVLDEDGIPNPSVVIDVYGTRRGPKRKSRNNLKMSAHHHQQPQLPAALQSIPLNSHSQQNQMPTSPPKSSSSVIDEVPALTLNMSLQQQKNQQQEQQTQKQQQEKQEKQNQQQQNQQQQQESENSSQNYNIPNLFSPLASLLQQNSNMAFVHLFNINLQMLAAQQQAAVLAHLSPGMREELQKYQEQNTQESEDLKNDGDCEGDGDDNDGEDAKEEEADERMEVSTATNSHTNNSPTPTASSSGNSSNSLSTASNGLTAYSSPAATPTMYECKYCDISFKNAVLYHIHMGYHSCDDVFKCNMCGEKCDGPVGLFVHIAHYAHS